MPTSDTINIEALDTVQALQRALSAHPDIDLFDDSFYTLLGRVADATARYRIANGLKPTVLHIGTAADFLLSLPSPPTDLDSSAQKSTAVTLALRVLARDAGFDAESARPALSNLIAHSSVESMEKLILSITSQTARALLSIQESVSSRPSPSPEQRLQRHTALLHIARAFVAAHQSVSDTVSAVLPPTSDVISVGSPMSSACGRGLTPMLSDTLSTRGSLVSPTYSANHHRLPRSLDLVAAASGFANDDSRCGATPTADQSPTAGSPSLDPAFTPDHVSPSMSGGATPVTATTAPTATATAAEPLDIAATNASVTVVDGGDGDTKQDATGDTDEGLLGSPWYSTTPLDTAPAANDTPADDDTKVEEEEKESAEAEAKAVVDDEEGTVDTSADTDAGSGSVAGDGVINHNCDADCRPDDATADVDKVNAKIGGTKKAAAELGRLHKDAEVSAEDIVAAGPTPWEALVRARKNHTDALHVGEGLLRDLFRLDELTGLSCAGRRARKEAVKEIQNLLTDTDTLASGLGKTALKVHELVGPDVKAPPTDDDLLPAKEETATATATQSATTAAKQPAAPTAAVDEKAVAMQVERVLQVARSAPLTTWLPPAEMWEESTVKLTFEAQKTHDGLMYAAHLPGIRAQDVQVDVRSKSSSGEGSDSDDTPLTSGEKEIFVSAMRLPTRNDIQRASPAILRSLADAVATAAAADAAAGRCVHNKGRAGCGPQSCPFTAAGVTEGVLHAAVIAAMRARFGRVSATISPPAAADPTQLAARYERGDIIVTMPWRLRQRPDPAANPQSGYPWGRGSRGMGGLGGFGGMGTGWQGGLPFGHSPGMGRFSNF